MSVMQRLYDSEINAWVSSFWDDGFYVRLGDEMNGFRAEGRCMTWDEVERGSIRRPGSTTRTANTPRKANADRRYLSLTVRATSFEPREELSSRG